MRGFAPQEASARRAKLVFPAPDLLGADRLLEREHEPGADRLHDPGVPASSRISGSGWYVWTLGLTKRIVPPPGTVGVRFANSARLATSTPGVPGPPTNLCVETKTASLYASCPSSRSGDGFMSIGRYGAAAA